MRTAFLSIFLGGLLGCADEPTAEQGNVQGLTLTPVDANGTDTLTCAWTGVDGSPSASIAWKVNGASVYGESDDSLDPEWFEKGDKVSCIVTPNFSGAVGERSNVLTIQNSPPILLSAELTPDDPTERDLIYASGTAEDPDREDSEKLFMHYKWMVNGEEVGYDEYVLGASWWEEGDNVSVYVSVGDGLERSPAELKGPVTILNSIPGAPEIEVLANEDGSLSCILLVEAEELDPTDTLTYGSRWREFGRVVLEESLLLPAESVREGAEYSCEMWASDEEGPGESATATLQVSGEIIRYRWAFNDAGALAGTDIQVMSDIDADGRGDLLVGTSGVTAQKVEVGGAVILGTTGIGGESALSDELIFHQILGSEAHAFLGSSIGTIPDFDGDGVDEIVLGTPDYTIWELEGGVAVAVGSTQYLSAPEYIFDPEGPIETAVGIVWGSAEGEGFGQSVLGMDLDQDGSGDMVVAIHTDDVQTPGSIRVVSGVALAAGGPTYMEATIANISGIPGSFGQETRLLPDGDGDGVSELLISAPELNNQNGSVLIMGSQDITLYDNLEDKVDSSASNLAIRVDGSDGEYFGANLVGGSLSELPAALVGAPLANGGAGAAYLMLPYESQSILDAVQFVGGDAEGWGGSVGFVGDTDRDGVDEIAIGAPASSVTFESAGAVYFFAVDDLVGGAVYDADDAVRVLYGEEASENTGSSVVNVGDVTGDGWEDLAIGASKMDAPDGWNEGGLSLWVRP